MACHNCEIPATAKTPLQLFWISYSQNFFGDVFKTKDDAGENAEPCSLCVTCANEVQKRRLALVMAAIGQGAINISEGIEKVEKGSLVHAAMVELCRMMFRGEITKEMLDAQAA